MPVRPSLQRKLLTLVAAAIATATLAASIVALWQQSASYAALRRQALVTTAQVFAAAAGQATATHNRDAAFAALRGMARIDGVWYAEIRTQGRILASFGAVVRLADDLSLARVRSPSVLDMLRSGTIEVAVPVVHGGVAVGEFTLVGGIADLPSQLLVTAAATTAGGALALVVGLLVAWRLQRRVVQPLRSLLRAVTQVREERRYDVAAEPAADHEIGELVDGFNRMLDDVRERDARLEAHARSLEAEVRARTSDLRVARDAAESASRAKSEFLATMSHEIRTPMNGIMVMAELLAQANLPPRQQRFADVITKSGKSLLAIINDILDFSKIEAGKLQLERLPVDVNAMAESVTSLFAERAREKNLDLAALVDPTVPRSIVSDPVRLGQIVSNLVNNALKFTATGSVNLSITRTAHPAGVEIAVTDTGVGIPADKLGTIFESFSQADQSTTRTFGGTGLGLTISRRLAQALGGDIAVTSQEGKGSTFVLSLPAESTEGASWPRLDPVGSEIAFCIVDIGGEATRSAVARYFAASGYTVLDHGQGLTPDECGKAAVICADIGKVAAYGGLRGPAGPRLVSLCPLGDPRAEGLVETGTVDGCLTQPVLRSEIEDMLQRLASGARDLQPTSASVESARTRRLRSFRALVADDNAVNREVALEALSQLGALVALVENGREAVDAAASGDFDVILMDGSMPVLDGYEAARRIRAAEQGRRRTPIIALTAHVIGAAAEEWRAAGMDDVVHKPFTVAKLGQTIEKLVPRLAAGGDAPPEPAPAGPASTPAGASLDPTVLDQLRRLEAGGKADFVKKVLGLYLEHAPAAVDQIRTAAANADASGCARAAHALKSMSYNIGASDVAKLAARIEELGKVQGLVPGHKEMAELAHALEAARKTVSRLSEFGNAPERAATPLASIADEREHALRQAVERNELSVHYQPIVDRHGARTLGVEALLRWQRGERSVAPAVFVPLAEKSGIIHDLGEWALRQACLDASAWPDIHLSVNVSPVQLEAPDLADRIERVVAETGFDWRRLQLEITETALLNAEDVVLAVMKRLKRNGASFALDDFGTGYSSLTYLRRFPFDQIKIDRSFISEIGLAVNATIVHAITSIGRSLGLKVVAEGIETAEQQRFLATAGVHFLQGYRFGRPVPREAITERLAMERQEARPASLGGGN